MRKIAVFTSTRADYGLLYWLIKAIHDDPEVRLQLIVSGTHLSPQYGETRHEIEDDGFKIDATVEMLLSSNTASGVVKSMGLASIGYADALERLQPDILVVLGDRFEALAISQAALIMKIPIAHIHGGELTLGAYDNSIRHAITKMASLHFVAAKAYADRVIQMGEQPHHVFNVGAPGLEQITQGVRLSFNELTKSLGLPLQKPYVVVTYHPVTLDDVTPEVAFESLLTVLNELKTHQILFTYPNADNGNYTISQRLERYCQTHHQRAFCVRSLGSRRYLSSIEHADLVIGNSSSGLIEVPAFGIPTINIGLRQAGRLAADSVIHVKTAKENVLSDALQQALSTKFKRFCQQVVNPYGDGRVASRILPELKRYGLSTMKHFQDLEVHDEPA